MFSNSLLPSVFVEIQLNLNITLLSLELDLQIHQLMTRNPDGTWMCHRCDYSTRARQGLVNHIESRHIESQGVQCKYCPRVCPTRHAMQMHVSRQHQMH